MPRSPIIDTLILRKTAEDIAQLRNAFTEDPNVQIVIDSHITGLGRVQAIYKKFGELAVDVPAYRLMIIGTDSRSEDIFIGLTPEDTIEDFQDYVNRIIETRKSGLNGFHIQTPKRFDDLIKELAKFLNDVEDLNPSRANKRFNIPDDVSLPLSTKYSIDGLDDPGNTAQKYWNTGGKSRARKLASRFSTAGTMLFEVGTHERASDNVFALEAQSFLDEIKALSIPERESLVRLVAESGQWSSGVQSFASSVLVDSPFEVYRDIDTRGWACNAEMALQLP